MHPSDTPHGVLRRDVDHDVAIIIPTVANPTVLVPAFDRLCRHLDGLRVQVIVSINPLNPAHGEESIRAISQLWRSYSPAGCHLTIYNHESAAGFGGAINLGIRTLLGMRNEGPTQSVGETPDIPYGIPPLTVIFNDDLHVTAGWLTGMLAALTSETVCEWSELGDRATKTRPMRSMADYVGKGSIGLVGPVTNVAAGIQVIGADQQDHFREVGIDVFAAEWRTERGSEVLTATFLSGYCMGLTFELIESLSTYTEHGSFDWLFDERFLVAGYEDNDICARADFAGFRAIVASNTFIGHLGHQTFDAMFPEMDRGMRNRLVYYDKWAPELASLGKSIVAAYRIRLDVPNDLTMLRMSLVRASQLYDGVAILVTSNPSAMLESEEFQTELQAKRVPGEDLDFLHACAGPNIGQKAINAAMGRWAALQLQRLPESRRPRLSVACWTGEFNERDERNALLELAEKLNADWIMSVDHDEALEPRVTREHLNRLISHPDPLVSEFDFAFVNHWIDNRMYRTDRPWGDGGSWTGGMRGYRLFRVNRANPRRILAGGHNGLHCGNVPGVDGIAKRTAGMRIRHFGYMRYADRMRKERRYNVQDPNPDPVLVGSSSYQHITAEEGMTLSPYVPVNGIGLHMLVYERETADNVGRLLDSLYSVADRVVLVWTGEWDDAHKGWLLPAPGGPMGSDVPRAGDGKARQAVVLAGPGDEWYGTGPGREMAAMAAHFGAEWVHQPLADDIAGARNAGLNALQGTPGMGWALFLDPDEHLPSLAPTMIRRMAEVSDAWGWMWRFRNQYERGGGNESESVRMSRLDPDGRMRMNGRVHESFSKAVKGLQDEGYSSILRSSPFVTINVGLARSPAAMDAKLEFYRRLTEMDLRDEPRNPTAWTTLGLYWLNEGCETTAMECFSRAVRVSTGEYLPFHTLGTQHLRLATLFLGEAESRMGNHRLRRTTRELVEGLREAVPPIQILGTVADGGRRALTDEEALPTLPPFLPSGDVIPTGGFVDAREGLLRIVFDGPPGPESGRFIECENSAGASVRCGEWVQEGTNWVLVVRTLPETPASRTVSIWLGGKWRSLPYDALRKGDIFQLFEPTGEPANAGGILRATSEVDYDDPKGSVETEKAGAGDWFSMVKLEIGGPSEGVDYNDPKRGIVIDHAGLMPDGSIELAYRYVRPGEGVKPK